MVTNDGAVSRDPADPGAQKRPGESARGREAGG